MDAYDNGHGNGLHWIHAILYWHFDSDRIRYHHRNSSTNDYSVGNSERYATCNGYTEPFECFRNSDSNGYSNGQFLSIWYENGYTESHYYKDNLVDSDKYLDFHKYTNHDVHAVSSCHGKPDGCTNINSFEHSFKPKYAQ